jgi:hypothetical protein
MKRLGLFAAAASSLAFGQSLLAQASKAPPEATELVVEVRSYFQIQSDDAETTLQPGSGIIVGLDDQRISIATARHVVHKSEPALRVYVIFRNHPNDSISATLSGKAQAGMDVAVLTIPRSRVPPGWSPPAFNRLGNVRKLGFGDPVYPMGCPQGICWGVPVSADRLVVIDRQGIAFQSVFVKSGSSGGAVFNQWWEVIGLVTEDEPPQANAVPIDQVLALVRNWGFPVSLRQAKVPRAGYPLHLGGSLLMGLGVTSDSLGDESRWPSGRLVATRRGELYGLTWHLSALRLAPPNLAVTAAMGGVGVNFSYGRVLAQPFLEIGLGRVEGRFDAGGYYVSGPDGAVYEPVWQQEEEDGLGVGVGLSVQAIVAPHVTLEVLGGHWSFSIPDSLQVRDTNLPAFFVGTGLRLGM